MSLVLSLAAPAVLVAVLLVAVVRRARRAADEDAIRELRETNPYEVTGPIPGSEEPRR